MESSVVGDPNECFLSPVTKRSGFNRFQALALGLGVFVTLLSLAMVFVYQSINIRTTTKIQNAFIEQYSGLIAGKFNDFDSKLKGLQAFLSVLNKNNNEISGFHINVNSSDVWIELHGLLSSSDSLFAASGLSFDSDHAQFDSQTELTPFLNVKRQENPLKADHQFRLILSVPMLASVDPLLLSEIERPRVLGMLNMQLNIDQLQKILDLLENTTKFAASLQFSNSLGHSFSINSKLFYTKHDTFYSPEFPRVTRSLQALGGDWTLELKPTLTTLELAGMGNSKMVLKLAACIAMGIVAWLILSYISHLFFTRQRQRLLDNLERTNAELTMQTSLLDASKKNAEDFIGILGHEIRNPLVTMNCVYAELERLELNQDAQKLLEIHGAALTTALDTLNNILDLKKMEVSALQLEHIEFEPLTIVNEMRGFIAVQCRSKRVTLKTDLDRAIPLKLMGDPLRLKQVLMNLMNNAVKFTRVGSAVELNVGVKEISLNQVTLSFEVSDCGDGIEPSMIKKLLEPYQQADSSIARHYGGTGLGLNIASRIILLMGGELQIESNIGVGTKCRFDLPFEYFGERKVNLLKRCEFDTDTWFQSKQQRPERQDGRLTMLYVDDNQFNLMIAEELLKKSNHQLVTFSSPKDALAFLDSCSEKIDIVISDLNMPEMSGIEFARHVRQGRYSNTLFLAVMTASSLEETQMLRVEDFDCVLAKPFNLEKIVISFDEFRSKAKVLLS